MIYKRNPYGFSILENKKNPLKDHCIIINSSRWNKISYRDDKWTVEVRIKKKIFYEKSMNIDFFLKPQNV